MGDPSSHECLAGDYRILSSLGAGASGEVFKAEHIITRRVDALKFLAHANAPTDEEQQRFLREIQLQASLQHPGIAAVHTAFRTPRGLALVMELVDGEPLDGILARGRIPLETGVSYLLETLSALQYAHERGVVHRDVKPANIIVTPGGAVKLTDFGLARRVEGPRLTHSGAFTGSPYYMPPEQVVGLSLADARCDIYAAGVILYEIAAGRRPFEAESAFEVMLLHRDAQPEPPISFDPAIGPALNGVILKAMAKDPAERYQTAADFRQALAEAAVPGPRPLDPGPSSLKVENAPVRRRGRPIALAAAVAALAVCFAGGMTWKAERQPVPRPPAPPVPGPPDPVLMALPPSAPMEAPAPLPEQPEAPPVRVRTPATRAARPLVLQPARPPAIRAAQTDAAPPPLPAAIPGPPPELRPVPRAARVAPVPTAIVSQAAVPAPPPKRRNPVWRALGRMVKPLAKRKTPAAEEQANAPE